MSVTPPILHLNDVSGEAPAIYRGDTYSHAITVLDAADVAVDLSTAVLTAEVRRTASILDTTVIATFTTAVSGVGNNIVTISLTAAVTTLLTPGTYRWDLHTVTAGVAQTWRKGQAVVVGDVTR